MIVQTIAYNDIKQADPETIEDVNRINIGFHGSILLSDFCVSVTSRICALSGDCTSTTMLVAETIRSHGRFTLSWFHPEDFYS